MTPTRPTFADHGHLADALERSRRRDGTAKLENNTFARYLEDGAITVRYHETDILTYHIDGTFSVDVDGWHTSTTAYRLNTYLPSRWSVRGPSRSGWRYGRTDSVSWEIYGSDPYGSWQTYVDYRGETVHCGISAVPMFDYFDGVRIRPARSGRRAVCVNYRDNPDYGAIGTRAGIIATNERDAKRYSMAYTARALHDAIGNTGGDCFMCRIAHANSAFHDASHIRSHIDETYVMGTLAATALQRRGYGPTGVAWFLDSAADGDGRRLHDVQSHIADYVLAELSAR